MINVLTSPFEMRWHPHEWMEVRVFEDRVFIAVHFGIWDDRESGRPWTKAFEAAMIDSAYRLGVEIFFSQEKGIAKGLQHRLIQPLPEGLDAVETNLVLNCYDDEPNSRQANAIGFEIRLEGSKVLRLLHRLQYKNPQAFGGGETLTQHQLPEHSLPSMVADQHRIVGQFRGVLENIYGIPEMYRSPQLVAAQLAIEEVLKDTN